MALRPRTVLLSALVAAAVVFCVVQDRVTAAGARRYVAAQRAALAGRGPAVTIDEVLRPAVRRSVQQAAIWSGMVLGAGVIAAGAIRRRGGRR